MNQMSYECPKCGNRQNEIDRIRTTGSAFAKIFDVQNKKYNAIT
ncbi:MAG: zinc ribbon domain-containing protein [Bacteroidota bacterium]|nr:zinc ribbon domain-containing protein [Bacteroidota bacterium]